MKPVVEQLESRSNPAVVATFAGGILTVTGDGNNNDIRPRVNPDVPGQIQILSDGSPISVIGGTPTLTNTTLLRVLPGSGNDVVVIDPSIDLLNGVVSLIGGAGDDTLVAGVDPANINGQGGNDSLVGGDANDSLFGGSGDDTLTGGAGVDSLYGQDGNDTLVNDGDDLLVD